MITYRIVVQIKDNESSVVFCRTEEQVNEEIFKWINPEIGYRRFKELYVYKNSKLIISIKWTLQGLERKEYETI